MRPLVSGILYLTATMLLSAPHTFAAEATTPAKLIGILNCKIVPQSGIDLLIHSTREILCEFVPKEGGAIERYKGETGVEFGIDVNIDKRASLKYVVRAERFRPGTQQLAGKYSGVGGSATFGLSVGNTAPISKQDNSVSLQPVGGKSSGSGFAAGFTYLYLEADR